MILEIMMICALNYSSPTPSSFYAYSESGRFTYEGVTSSGFCDVYDDDLDIVHNNIEYTLTTDLNLYYDLLATSRENWYLQINSFRCTSSLYINSPLDNVGDDLLYNNYSFNSSNDSDAYFTIDASSVANLQYLEISNNILADDGYGVVQFLVNDNYNNTADYYAEYYVDYIDFARRFTALTTRIKLDDSYLLNEINKHLDIGFGTAYSTGYSDGFNSGYADGSRDAYSEGYSEGYEVGSSQDEIATSIFVGIINVALLPINMFLSMLNFEVFGINIGGFVSSLLTIAIVVIIMRIVLNGGNKSD